MERERNGDKEKEGAPGGGGRRSEEGHKGRRGQELEKTEEIKEGEKGKEGKMGKKTRERRQLLEERKTKHKMREERKKGEEGERERKRGDELEIDLRKHQGKNRHPHLPRVPRKTAGQEPKPTPSAPYLASWGSKDFRPSEAFLCTSASLRGLTANHPRISFPDSLKTPKH